MPSSRAIAACAVVLALAASARAQTPARGFAVERFYPSAPGAGWLVMDTLELDGGLGGAIALTVGYAGDPLRVASGGARLDVVSDHAFADVGAAITWRRFRFYLNATTPLVISGQSGSLGGYDFTAPSVDPSATPDALSDARLGADVRIAGRPGGHFRFGASAQLFVPFGERARYDGDDSFRGMLRALFAGDARWLTWAAQLGVHIRPLDEAAPGSPRGSELLFGVAAGARLPIGTRWLAVVGPELFGATPFRAFFGGDTTALEALVSGRFETTRAHRANVRLKLGVGAGLDHAFGAPAWRIVAAVELFGRR